MMIVTFKVKLDEDDFMGDELRPHIRKAVEEALDYIDVCKRYPFRGMVPIEKEPFITSEDISVGMTID